MAMTTVAFAKCTQDECVELRIVLDGAGGGEPAQGRQRKVLRVHTDGGVEEVELWLDETPR